MSVPSGSGGNPNPKNGGEIWCPCFLAWQPHTDAEGKCPAYLRVMHLSGIENPYELGLLLPPKEPS